MLAATGGCAPPPSGPVEQSAPAPSRNADTRLLVAAADGDLAGVRQALADGASTKAVNGAGASALVLAAYGNHLPVAQVLLAAGADPNLQDQTQQSAYLIATYEVGDDPRLLELTLANGADVTGLDSYRGTGLIRAADRGHLQIVRRLIAAGVALDHVNRLGWTALLEAVILGGGDRRHELVVGALLDAGADPAIADSGGLTALDHARRNGYGGMVALLTR